MARQLCFGPARSRTRFDVLDEGTKLRHNLVASWMIQEYARGKRREGLENAQQLTFRDRSSCDWCGQLCQPYSLNCSTEQGWKVVRNIWPIDGDLDRLTIVVESPRSDCASRAAPTETRVVA